MAFPTDMLQLMFDLEADRIQNLDINADVVDIAKFTRQRVQG